MGASQLPGWVSCLLGIEASQLPGVRRGMGASQLWSWVLLLSTFFFLGGEGRVSFRGGEREWG